MAHRHLLVALVAALSTSFSQPARAFDDNDPYVMFGLNLLGVLGERSAFGVELELRVMTLLEEGDGTETSLGAHASFAWLSNGGQLELGVDYSAYGDDDRVIGFQLGVFRRLHDKREDQTGVALEAYVGSYRLVELGAGLGMDLEGEFVGQLRLGLFFPGRTCGACSGVE